MEKDLHIWKILRSFTPAPYIKKRPLGKKMRKCLDISSLFRIFVLILFYGGRYKEYTYDAFHS